MQLIYRHSPPSKKIEAIVDSGSPHCLFHAAVGKSIGIRKIESGIEGKLAGVIGGPNSPTVPIFYHKVKIRLWSSQFETMVGFTEKLAWGDLLGMKGFFENYIVKIDMSEHPPKLEVDRILRI